MAGANDPCLTNRYGAGARTGILNVEGKLAKVLGKDEGKLIIRASERDAVLSEISARAAKLDRWDPEGATELMNLRKEVKDIFDKGLQPGDEIMEDLWFLNAETKGVVDKMTRTYNDVVTPNDFAAIAKIMSGHMSTQVPILNDFTKFFGRLAEDFAINASPQKSAFAPKELITRAILGKRNLGFRLHPKLAEILGTSANETVLEKILKRLPGFNPESTVADLLFGTKDPKYRKIGDEYGGVKLVELIKVIDPMTVGFPTKDMKKKKWTQIPWVNFDGKTVEQHYTQRYEEKLVYKSPEGEWITNIIQVDQKTDPTLWQQIINKDGRINDIMDATQARTAYAVNGNHSNDAVIVKNVHLWGKKNNVGTSTIHDAFFTNLADMIEAKKAIRSIYAQALNADSIKKTLDELLARGLPKELYNKYLDEAISKGLIPVAGKSSIGGKVLKESDILKVEDILQDISEDIHKNNYGFYGIG